MTATRLKTGRGKHASVFVSAGSPTKDGSASSETGIYIQAGSYCKITSDGAGGLKLANITTSTTTPTDGDNAYITKSILFNFSADTMTDKYVNTLPDGVLVVTDLVASDEDELVDYGQSIEYSNGTDAVVEKGNTELFIAPAAIEITNVDVKAGAYATARADAKVQLKKDSTNILSTAITVTSALQTAVLNTASKLMTADQVLSISVHDGTWTGISHLNVTVSYKYR